VAANKISLRNKISRADGVFAHAQVGNGQTTGFFGVIDEVSLGIPRGRIADDFDVVFGRRDAAVAAQTIEQCLKFGIRWYVFSGKARERLSHHHKYRP
jgi:hypothetical protein